MIYAALNNVRAIPFKNVGEGRTGCLIKMRGGGGGSQRIKMWGGGGGVWKDFFQKVGV